MLFRHTTTVDPVKRLSGNSSFDYEFANCVDIPSFPMSECAGGLMGGGGGGDDPAPLPETPAPPPPPEPMPPPVTKIDEEAQQSKKDALKAEARKSGRKSTRILSGDLQPAETQKKTLLGG
jgi:hypothetical protein